MQVTHPFYKYLVKNDITKIRDILVWAQKYFKIEEATRAASTRPPRQGPKSRRKATVLPRKNLSYNASVSEPA